MMESRSGTDTAVTARFLGGRPDEHETCCAPGVGLGRDEKQPVRRDTPIYW